MTVNELIELLQALPPEARALQVGRNDCSYGAEPISAVHVADAERGFGCFADDAESLGERFVLLSS